MFLHIGIDDTDSPFGGCTTYIGARLVEGLVKMGAKFVDYPNLLRLNPNVPWKTRGNGAICLRVEIDPRFEADVKRMVLTHVEKYSEFEYGNTNPGIVFKRGGISKDMEIFSEKVVNNLATIEEVKNLVNVSSVSAIGYKNMRGIIGGLAAIGGLQKGDYTYEFLAYRKPENWGSPRKIDENSVRKMDKNSQFHTFNNLDLETGRILIAPKGPDPVLFGVRGETPKAVRESGLMIFSEPIERWVIFRTNQGTDAHLQNIIINDQLEPNRPAIVEGKITVRPITIKGGHVITSISYQSEEIDCAAYEPSGKFRTIIRSLIPGDTVRAYGGIKERVFNIRLTLNLEKLEVISLSSKVRLVNPKCPNCSGGMESIGRQKGFRCRKCSYKDPELVKKLIIESRAIEPGLYMPPLRAQRHLTKPFSRYGKEKTDQDKIILAEPWCWSCAN
jgi:tRNA(Ile2)-agmatinylcytidine synthase